MESISGFSLSLARALVNQSQQKPLWGQPFVRYGPCCVLAGYFMQMGSVLGTKYRHQLDDFALAFLGIRGNFPGAIQRFVDETVQKRLMLINEPMSFMDYVLAEEGRRSKSSGDSMHFFFEHGARKVSPDTGATMVWEFAEHGATLGATHPEIARRLFEHTYRTHEKEKWAACHAAGVGIPPEQETMSYDEVVEEHNKLFMEYCQKACPSCYDELTRHTEPSQTSESFAFSVEHIEAIVNRTIPGLTMYVRDANLPELISEKYKKGMIIREKAYCDASNRIMGMVTTHRYGILSNHMVDLSESEHGMSWGLHVAKRDSRFKVLETYEYNGKRLILLLHLPDDDSWRIFKATELSIERQLVLDCIDRFKKKCEVDTIPELAKDDWLERCAFPVGMDDEGNFFDIE